MGRRTAKILVPALLIPIAVCLLVSVMVWILSPSERDARGANSQGSTFIPLATTSQPASAGQALQPAVSDADAPPLLGEAAFATEQSRIALYERVGPAVVSIDTANVADSEVADSESVEQAQGSGFLVDAKGHIVTNNHVVEGAQSIYVTFADGRQVPAELVGRDPDSDLAVIKVADDVVKDIQPIEFADSKQVRVGQDTIAIGNPFGLQNTMTMGIVSAVDGRSLPGRSTGSGGRFQISRIIQTDAAINPGNSGGPLLDSRGRLIGINTAIRVSDTATTPQFAGIGYAVPSNTIKVVVEDLIATGEHKSAYLGVSMLSITPQLAAQFNLPLTEGVLVSSVVAGGPAANAGITIGSNTVDLGGDALPIDGDIILAYNGETLRSSNDLIAAINDSRVGDIITLTVRRGEETREVKVTLAERP